MKKNNLEKRAVAADAKHAGALSLFHKAAAELDAAADEHLEIARAAELEAQLHQERAEASSVSAKQAITAAARLRELVG